VAELTRILSDIHFGDRASRVVRLTQLQPLFDGVTHLVLNGDTTDTRPGPDPQHTAACRAEVMAFFPRAAPALTILTGNHDADLTEIHSLELAAGGVFVVHGDIFFDNIVPWSVDAPLIERLLAAGVRDIPPDRRDDPTERMRLFRKVAAAIPQRHQSEKCSLRYYARFLHDIAWPPTRVWRILEAWRLAPRLAGRFAQQHRPAARFVVSGHTHHPGIWFTPERTVINTGSYCPPLGGTAVDLTADQVVVRSIVSRGGEFRLGDVRARFPLARR
jgi:predicted phosphodiesterase